MRVKIVRATLLMLLLIAVASPVAAGGWATVRLDEDPGSIIAGEPWQFGFTVRQHDRTPTNDVNAVVRAVHIESGENVSAEGLQIGAAGHFEARIRFPVAGEWKWEIVPEPFGATSFETLTVLPGKEALSVTSQPVTISSRNQRTAPAAGSAALDAVEVTITDTGFIPSRIEIAPGTEVLWTNASSVAHGVMSDSREFSDSGLLETGDSFRQVFATDGTFDYWCGPHPSMIGTVVVTE